MGDYSDQSEWNEQQLFAQLFFGISERCREAQMAQNVMTWKSCLDSKFLLVMGITNDEGKEKIDKIRRVINTNSHGLMTKGKDKQAKMGVLFDTLFYGEVLVDTIANQHMPFLKLKRKVDIRGL